MTTIESTQRSAGGIVLIVGAVLGLVALASLAGGGVLTWAHTTKRDHDRFYTTATKTLTTPTYALVSDGLDIDSDGPDWLFREGRLGTIRVTATGSNGKPIFVGIAAATQADRYLRGVPADEIADFEVDPFAAAYDRRPGSVAPAKPAKQGLWAKSATGSGEQTLTWPVQKGSWDVVVMNADGTAGVRTDVSVGAKVPIVFWLGVGMLVAGGLLAIGAGTSIYAGSRRWHSTSPQTHAAGVVTEQAAS